MSIRVALLFVVIVYLSVYAWRKSWFNVACSSILLFAVLRHEDFPRSMLGIPGLNPWNILIANAFFSWCVNRERMETSPELPPGVRTGLLLLIFVMVVSSVRLLFNVDSYNLLLVPGEGQILRPFGFTDVIIDNLLEEFKFLVPLLLIFDGCRSRRNLQTAVGCLLGYFILSGIQVVRAMPLSALTMSAAELSHLSAKLVLGRLGFSRVTVSMLLCGGCWACIAALPWVRLGRYRLMLLGAAGIVAFGQALTGGRMGYVSFAAVGAVLCALRWRRYFLLLPVLVAVVLVSVPSVRERMFLGWATESEQTDKEAMTSGRATIWPVVIDKIAEAPLFGYGRQGMITSGAHKYISDEIYGEADFPHPHNAYLQIALDNGIVGVLLMIPFYVVMLTMSVRMFLNRNDTDAYVVGGIALALLLTLFFSAMGGQTFYLSAQTLPLFSALALLVKVNMGMNSFDHSGGPNFEGADYDGGQQPEFDADDVQ